MVQGGAQDRVFQRERIDRGWLDPDVGGERGRVVA